MIKDSLIHSGLLIFSGLIKSQDLFILTSLCINVKYALVVSCKNEHCTDGYPAKYFKVYDSFKSDFSSLSYCYI